MRDDNQVNELIRETSPYLQQHAHNPVHWMPWGETALRRAREENKPILLSIGYSACHWCHVMAHESFDDEETAALMNRYFINIKVDREERPDIDKIYQTAQQLLTQRNGGWPLTMFLTPDDHVPFFGGTYFPPEPRYGMPGFKDLLTRVARFYEQEQDGIRQQNASMLEALRRLQGPAPAATASELTPAPLHEGVDQLAGIFDEHHGGFGGAPKFPHPTHLEVLLDYGAARGLGNAERARSALQMARFTLERMALGGLHDQIGGGFSRYSVDALWMIPHFEKMLYDNGPLLSLYAEAWKITGEPLFRRVADETAGWVMREMQSPEGGYYSSLDADSEGEEGRFYVWARDEVRASLDADEYEVFSRRFGLDREPNFEGHWHLHVFNSLEEVARETGHEPAAARDLIDRARGRLLCVRGQRVRPGRDEKILTSWNGLMIRGMASAALRFGNGDYLQSAERAMEFTHQILWQDGRLWATYKDGRAHLNAYLDDYALLLHALLRLLECRWSNRWLEFAVQLAEGLLRDFQDAESGGFFFTSHDHEPLIQKRKDFTDDALPSGNGIAALALIRLGHLIGEQRYLRAAEATLRAAWEPMNRLPHAFGALLLSLSEFADPPQQIILRGAEHGLEQWQRRVTPALNIRSRLFAIPDTAGRLPGLLAERRAGDGVVAWLCEGFQCRTPIHDVAELEAVLKAPEGG
ncbi:MAG: thioredoxin domain-containing protein [Gammaproteobacteria bacterium]|nr:thioredoxin domain-containing protein [Gammaproteobacteria bacterium]